MIASMIRVFLFVVGLGIVLGGVIGMGYEIVQARELVDSSLDAVAYYQSRLAENEKMMNACIKLYGEAERVDTECQIRLQRCVGIKEFGK